MSFREPSVFHIGMSASRFRNGISESCKRITEWINKAKNQLFIESSCSLQILDTETFQVLKTFSVIHEIVFYV